ncbi:hypothetical protein [Pseudomonas lundensis]|jgi:predicted Ser/Thr protein kinase|uniref:hypothetical protein n=1 Tax=Pseudomonas lundensis TaxID=86185 RepID=UPI00089DA936|nr:hypothetical protein [Pseudomonas lundensis]
MHADPSNKRDAICKVRFTQRAKRQLQMEARMAGMQLATYLYELAELGRAQRAADAIREIYGVTAHDNHKSA